MQEFIAFIKEYKEVLIGAVCVLISIISLFIKRKPKTLDDFLVLLKEVCLSLPELINQVEESGHGDRKKFLVQTSAINLMSKKLGRKLTEKEMDVVNSEVAECIEAILSTPQKKGN